MTDLNTEVNVAQPIDQNDVEALIAELSAVEIAAAKPADDVVVDEELALLEAVAEDVQTQMADTADAGAVTTNMVLDEDMLADLDLAVTKAEAYADQDVSASPSDEAMTNPVAAATPVPKAARKARAASAAPVKSRDLATIADAVFQLRSGDTDMAARKAEMISKRPAQVKIAEKFDQLWACLEANKAPSRYVVDAYKALKAKGSITNTEVVGAFKAAGLGDGTARSQAGQIMVLFDTVQIAGRSGQTLTLNADSTVAAKLDAILGA